jgi:hypothetical protein
VPNESDRRGDALLRFEFDPLDRDREHENASGDSARDPVGAGPLRRRIQRRHRLDFPARHEDLRPRPENPHDALENLDPKLDVGERAALLDVLGIEQQRAVGLDRCLRIAETNCGIDEARRRHGALLPGDLRRLGRFAVLIEARDRERDGAAFPADPDFEDFSFEELSAPVDYAAFVRGGLRGFHEAQPYAMALARFRSGRRQRKEHRDTGSAAKPARTPAPLHGLHDG